MKERSREGYEEQEVEEVEEVEDKGTEKIVGGKRRWECIVIEKETKITNGIRV